MGPGGSDRPACCTAAQDGSRGARRGRGVWLRSPGSGTARGPPRPLAPCPLPLAPCPLPSHLKSGPPSPSSAQGQGRTPQTGHAQQAITVPRARPPPPLRLSAVPKASIVPRARPSQGPVRTERSSPRRPRVPVSPALLDSTAQPRAQVGSGSTRPPWAPGPRALRQARDKWVGGHQGFTGRAAKQPISTAVPSAQYSRTVVVVGLRSGALGSGWRGPSSLLNV